MKSSIIQGFFLRISNKHLISFIQNSLSVLCALFPVSSKIGHRQSSALPRLCSFLTNLFSQCYTWKVTITSLPILYLVFFFVVLAATLQIIAFCYRLLQQDTYATKRLVDVITVKNLNEIRTAGHRTGRKSSFL